MSEVIQKATLARNAAPQLAALSTGRKNEALHRMADALLQHAPSLIDANAADLARGRETGLSVSLLDRLALNEKRIEAMAEGLRLIAGLPDPVGESLQSFSRPNGLRIEKVRVPLGVIGIIYEARPNVTVDAAGLCFKTGNAVVLRGGSAALESNKRIAAILHEALQALGLPADVVQVIESTDRASADEMLKLNGYIDVLIPRGGASLIQNVVKNATVPVIETGAGICHTYIDDSANPEMAQNIALNAKVQRPSVCNAMETLLVHEAYAERELARLAAAFRAANVELRGCSRTLALVPDMKPAADSDWDTEYNDYILNVRVVAGLDEALAHISAHGTKHSECIVTENDEHAVRFLNEVDAAAVYHNASTRFTDGFEFGFGAEIGISTQKLHARGPMGLPELTSYKYKIAGSGQIRS
ncbi:gamma-glutamyl phosphate reductase [Gordoniibacillus kamchatkensis]|uniref:Gamma-glutamyl phosphate reductase n=1 Tax=Gordoniibacillus kamchatkensis TaxID=1590651 RepID=A0ABR5AHI7_9BACL|nr:glutamate-5-semialdehyde dehydrogenase [Paenibacillus sp. VKM B-2647]KIL40045.1 gamma-glutamyl phosphate reductase [Paenibacillus sp. VKM B-2647]